MRGRDVFRDALRDGDGTETRCGTETGWLRFLVRKVVSVREGDRHKALLTGWEGTRQQRLLETFLPHSTSARRYAIKRSKEFASQKLDGRLVWHDSRFFIESPKG